MAKPVNVWKNKKFRISFIVVAICLGLGLIAAGVTYLIRDNDKQSADDSSVGDQSEEVVSPEEQTTRFINLGNYEEASALASKQLEDAKSDDERAEWLLRLHSIAANSDDFQASLDYAKRAYEISKTTLTADVVAQAYAWVGDSSAAQKYWQEAIDLLDKDLASYQISKQRLQDKIDKL